MRTRDVDGLALFYSSVLALPIVRRDPERGSVWLDAGGTVLMIERAGPLEPPVAPGAMELVAFSVAEKETWRLKLEDAGVAIEDESRHTIYFRDPDGRRVAVSDFVFA